MSVRPDPITWKQIGTGYVILICIGLGTAAAMLDPRGASIASDPFRSMIGFAVLAVLYGVWKLLEPPLSRAATRVAPTPDGKLRLKRKAVAAMWLLSILLCIAAVRVTQLVNPW
jgi:hypothetical protein